MLFVDIKHRPV